jgi:hypothetical protein
MRFILFFFTAAAMGVAALAQDTNLHTNVHELYLQDQSDRGVGGGKAVSNWQDLVKRDNARRGRVRELLASGALKTAEDFHDAAFIFQHSVQTDQYPLTAVASDYLLAHVLASVAVAKGDSKSLWISAASLDRYLQLIGQAQVFGTQYQSKDDKPYTQEPYNRTLIPDALRLVFCVPSLEQQKSNVADFNAGKYPAGILPAGCQR